MASESDYAPNLSDELQSMASTSPTSQDLDQQSSISSHVSDNTQVDNASSEAQEGQTNVDHLIERRIKKIYKRLKETDANIKTMETLLDWKREENFNMPHSYNFKKEEPVHGISSARRRAKSPKTERRLSTSSQSSLDIYQHSRGNSRKPNLAKSIESLHGAGRSQSPTLKQLQQLTQSMQDLHNFQQRFQDDLKMEVRNISRNETHDVLHELSAFIKRHSEERMSCKEILGKLLELQNELKASHNQDDFRIHILHLVENMKKEMEHLKCAMSSSSISADANGLLKKLSNVESQQEKLEHTLEVLLKQMEIKNQTQSALTSQDIVDSRHKNAQVQDLQQQMEKNVQLSLETSKQIQQMSEEFQRIQLGRSSRASDRDSDKHKAKQVVQKLRTRCEGLLIEKRHFEEMCHANEERIHGLLREKEVLLMQLDEFQNKLFHSQKELQTVRATFMDGQMENLKNETTLQQFKLLYDNNLKNLASCQEEIEQMKILNGKLLDENGSLQNKINNLNKETNEQLEKLAVASNSMQELKTSDALVEHLKEKIAVLGAQNEDAKQLYTKQINEEKETSKLLREELAGLKATCDKEIANAVLRKEAEFGPILALLKQQISDCQKQINTLQQENRNIGIEKSQMNQEVLKMQSEIRDAHKRHEKLMKNYYLKDEALRLKINQSETQESTMADFRKVARKMEQEYKSIISTINAEVDHTLQLWNKASTSTLQVFTPANGSPVHPKVQLVEIQSKLKWIQDDLCVLLARNERIPDSTLLLPKTSTSLNKQSSNTNIALSKPNILAFDIPSGNIRRESSRLHSDRETYKFRDNLSSFEFSYISKAQQEDQRTENFKRKKDPDKRNLDNNVKQMNSTEIENGSNLPINQLSFLCRNDIQSAKKNMDSQHQYRALSPQLSSINEPSDDLSTDNQFDCFSSTSD